MIKVLRIINRFNLGGPTYNAAYLSKYLGEDFETLLLGGEKDDSEDSSTFILDSLDLKPVIISEMKRSINWKNDRAAYKQIKQIIKEFKPDIVHTHASKAGTLGRLAAYNCGVKVILHTFHGHVFHSYFNRYKTIVFKNIERYLARKSTKIIAISEIQKHELGVIHKICNPKKIEVIPLGFDLSRFVTDQQDKRMIFRSNWKIKEDEVAIGIIGRLVPIKNHILFIDAINRLQHLTHARFFIIGDGESRTDLEAYCKKLNLPYVTEPSLQGRLTFTSWIKEIDICNAGLDIICLTSLNEGTPVSLIEAQAAQKPIVSTRVGGIENIVIEGKTALLSESSDLESFSKNLSQLITDPQLRTNMGLGGKHVMEKFHYVRLANDMARLYRQLVKN